MPKKKGTTPKKRRPKPTYLGRNPEVLDVHMAAELLHVSTDTVYDLLKAGELPGRKVGRKWLTTRSGLLRWIEGSIQEDQLQRAIRRGDTAALASALNKGKARVK